MPVQLVSARAFSQVESLVRVEFLEHLFDSGGMELLGRWWNGRYGRIARRDLWLYGDDGRFVVHARIGDSEAPVQEWPFACEPDARAKIHQLIRTGGDGWRDLTDLYRRPDR